jgi:hypothetical protein
VLATQLGNSTFADVGALSDFERSALPLLLQHLYGSTVTVAPAMLGPLYLLAARFDTPPLRVRHAGRSGVTRACL